MVAAAGATDTIREQSHEQSHPRRGSKNRPNPNGFTGEVCKTYHSAAERRHPGVTRKAFVSAKDQVTSTPPAPLDAALVWLQATADRKRRLAGIGAGVGC